MAEQQGGYRQPANPAPASGPGALSQRTDGSPTQPATYISGLPYGQGQQTYDNQVAAPMAGNTVPQMAGMNLTSLSDPTQFPDEPGTAGIDMGLGVGSSAMGLPMSRPSVVNVLQKLAMFDDSGEAELILQQFNQ
jgi:hypothetical protein